MILGELQPVVLVVVGLGCMLEADECTHSCMTLVVDLACL